MLCVAAVAARAETIVHSTIGTGFFVSKDGHIITNAHVVKECLTIDIEGPIKDQALIVAIDPHKDLAILKIPHPAPMVAPLRWNLETLRVGDKVAIIGYPGQAGINGQLRYGTSQISGLQGPDGEPQWIQFKPILEKGNSGGPLLDGTGNVIGVVTGKVQVFQTDMATGSLKGLLNEADIAVTLNELRGFLDKAMVRYYQASSGMLSYADQRLGEISRNFVVHVRCTKGVR